MSEVYLSREGYQKLREELKKLHDEERQAVQQAREFREQSEYSDYSAAKEQLVLLELRINNLEETLCRARLLEDTAIPANKVYIGATVELLDFQHNRALKYTLVAPEEADFEEGKIATVSPIGKGLLAHSEDAEVEIQVPAGILHFKIGGISR